MLYSAAKPVLKVQNKKKKKKYRTDYLMAFLCLKPPIYFLMCLGDSPSSVAHLQSPAIGAASGPHSLTLPSARLTHPPGPGLPFSLLTDLALPALHPPTPPTPAQGFALVLWLEC